MSTPGRKSASALASLALMMLIASSANALPPPTVPVIKSVVVAPDRSILVHIALRGYNKSTDGGLTWRHSWDNEYAWQRFDHEHELKLDNKGALPLGHGTAAVPAPGPHASIGEMHYSCFNSHLYRSSNSGTNWVRASDLPAGASQCSNLVEDGTYFYSITSIGIIRRPAQDGAWKLLSVPDVKQADRLMTSQKGIVVANVHDIDQRKYSYLSEDRGNTWKEVIFPSKTPHETWCGVVGIAGEEIFARCGSALFSSKNNGRDWSSADAGLQTDTTPPGRAIIIEQVLDGGDGGVYASSPNALFKRMNADSTWKLLPLRVN
ncbi:hypothetical protein [Massilia rubra]|uniref:Exo-alpha-sialidase n=1 Tax=Massilia rubra TaxID=2607910 RepID=A0ABX0LSQ3_9BURK|nr:hypothetical protein [Massilia rubra]NHZ37014.1 hypothetical protein [Massilia rubra]